MSEPDRYLWLFIVAAATTCVLAAQMFFVWVLGPDLTDVQLFLRHWQLYVIFGAGVALIARYAKRFNAASALEWALLKEERVLVRWQERQDEVGWQLGKAIGQQVDDLAGAVYDYAKHDSLRHMTEGQALDMMLSLHVELVREDR